MAGFQAEIENPLQSIVVAIALSEGNHGVQSFSMKSLGCTFFNDTCLVCLFRIQVILARSFNPQPGLPEQDDHVFRVT